MPLTPDGTPAPNPGPTPASSGAGSGAPHPSGHGPPQPSRSEIRPLGSGGLGSAQAPVSKITQFEQRFSAKRHEDSWKRSPNANGTGAIHVKSFHCKLVGESLEFLDQQINEWLDAHPQYEVKFVNATVGEWTGKLKEPNLVIQVWV